MITAMVDLAGWVAGLDAVLELIASRFPRVEPRRRVGSYLRGLLAGLERKNGWTLAEHAGAGSPDGMQRLLRTAGWDVVNVGNFRGNVPSTTVYYPEGLEEAAALLAADLPGPDRTRPAFRNISQTRLTVIVADEYDES